MIENDKNKNVSKSSIEYKLNDQDLSIAKTDNSKSQLNLNTNDSEFIKEKESLSSQPFNLSLVSYETKTNSKLVSINEYYSSTHNSNKSNGHIDQLNNKNSLLNFKENMLKDRIKHEGLSEKENLTENHTPENKFNNNQK